MENPTSYELNLLTPTERAKEERNAQIAADYTVMKGKARPWRIFSALAEKYNMTATGIYLVIARKGLYTSKG